MKIGLISDVHSNAPALEVVLQYLEDAGVDRIIHAGDVIGYNPFPNEVIELLREKNIESIIGNHEIVLLSGDTSLMSSLAKSAIEWTGEVLAHANTSYLESLKEVMRFEVGGVRLSIHHGSPSSVWRYVYSPTMDLLREASADILVLGHTHVPFVMRFKDGMVVNPGSVGQPRDHIWKASCAIIEPEKMEVDIKRLEYDVESVRTRIREVGLPIELGDRLLFGI